MHLFDRNRHGPKIGGSATFWEGGWVPIYIKVAWAEAYVYTKWHLDASSRLATIKWAENWGLCPLFFGGGSWVPI